MTPYKNFSKYPSWKTRIRKGGIYVAVALAMGIQSGCGSDNGSDWEEVTTYETTKGVVTTLEETEPGQFTIIDERVTDSKDSSRVIVKYLDGSTQSLSLTEARGLVQPQDTVSENRGYHRHGIGHSLWWGSMGYMMGRSLGTPVFPGVYRNYSAGGSQTSQELRRTAISRTEMRPIQGRKGFFRSWSRGGRGG